VPDAPPGAASSRGAMERQVPAMTAHRTYGVEDGDVMVFKFNV
jgi:hypothetical protein